MQHRYTSKIDFTTARRAELACKRSLMPGEVFVEAKQRSNGRWVFISEISYLQVKDYDN